MADLKKLIELYGESIASLKAVPAGNTSEVAVLEAAMTTAEAAVLAMGTMEAATVKATVAEAMAFAHHP
ncbi:hypothetical protein [Mesorhizobium sp.]|uniref:hypothetical protein n=1 Tax=Mesorhizobium sp. TaxID=1871066 RepID=UPI000FE91D9C|nr:hypothetical protein [Mesorhizobium sp.]RWE56385.1 MAG: hypothetical protein EOS67_18425 [Mesorhizobium sp.]